MAISVTPRQADEYRAIARRYAGSGERDCLRQIAQLTQSVVDAGFGPEALVHLHIAAQTELLDGVAAAEQSDIAGRLATLLLSAMLRFSALHRRVVDSATKLKEKNRALTALEAQREWNSETSGRTVELAQAEKMMALGRLVAGVTHEINEPLNAVKIVCQDILRDARRGRVDIAELINGMEDVSGEVQRIVEIVVTMRQFTRKVGRSEKRVVDLAAALAGVITMFGRQLRVQGAEIAVDLEDGLRVRGDMVKLQQVFMNLISNAWDAVKDNDRERGRKIAVIGRCLPTGTDQRLAVLEVRDNGGGVSRSLQDEIFEPFYTTKPRGEGTGLGLSISKKIVEEHGGKMRVESDGSSGTSFWVSLPAE